MMRFDRFTEKAQEAAMRAYEILQHYKHTQVDTEHLFLALLQQRDGAVPQILTKLEASVDVMARKLEATLEGAPKSGNSAYANGPTAQVFITRSFEVLRPDILQALNRLSSTVYVMMILSVTKQPLTVKQIQQRLGETQ